MSALVAQAVYVVVAVVLVGGTTWSLHRHSAPLLFDLLDGEEMVTAAVHRLLAVGHLLLGGAVAVALMPSTPAGSGLASALFSSTAGLLGVLALGHLGLVALHLRVRSNRALREIAANRPWTVPDRPWTIPGATPPTVPMPRPTFSAPPPGHQPQAFYPPSPPPWCRPLPSSYDVWAPPPR